MRKAYLYIAILIASLSIWTPKTIAQEGNAVFPSLSLPLSASALGLGGSTVSLINNDPTLLFSSPALLYQEAQATLSFGYHYGLNKRHGGYALYSQAIGERGSLATAVRYSGYNRLEGYDIWGISTGSFSAKNMVISGAYSYRLSDYFTAGLSLNLLYAHIDIYRALGISTDLGLNYFDPEDGLSVGIAFRNMGGLLKGFNQKRETLYPDFSIGFSKQLGSGPFSVHLTGYDFHPKQLKEAKADRGTLEQIMRHFLLGAECRLDNGLWLTLGFNPKINQDLQIEGASKFSGSSLALGLDHKKIKLAVAFAYYQKNAIYMLSTLAFDIGKE